MNRILKVAKNPLFILHGLSKIYEKAFTVRWTIFFRIKCSLMGIYVGKAVEIYGNCIVRKYPLSNVYIGNNVQIISSSWRSSTASCINSKIRTYSATSSVIFADGSGMTGGTIISRSKPIIIGEKCMLAPNVTIMDSDWHTVWPPENRNDSLESDADRGVTLEENVWVGMNVIILKGVTIGRNSVIAAGSIVTKSIPANCLAGGNPAKVLKQYK